MKKSNMKNEKSMKHKYMYSLMILIWKTKVKKNTKKNLKQKIKITY